jgi:hypothetical protein
MKQEPYCQIGLRNCPICKRSPTIKNNGPILVIRCEVTDDHIVQVQGYDMDELTRRWNGEGS